MTQKVNLWLHARWYEPQYLANTLILLQQSIFESVFISEDHSKEGIYALVAKQAFAEQRRT